MVTGASGALGAWVVKSLLDESVEVTALCGDDDRCLRLVVDAGRLTALRRIDADVLDRTTLRDAMRGVTHVVHTDPWLAAADDEACADLARSSISLLDDLLRAAQVAGVAGVAFESSMSAFTSSRERVSPHERPAPTCPRGCVHLAREMVAARWADAHHTPNTGLRIGLLYGPGLDEGPGGLVARAVASAIENQPFLIENRHEVDFQYLGDVADTLCAAARSSSGHQMINLTCGVTSTAHLQRLLTSLTGAAGVDLGGAADSFRIADSAPSPEAFGRLPTDLEQGLRATIESIRWAPRDLATGSKFSH